MAIGFRRSTEVYVRLVRTSKSTMCLGKVERWIFSEGNVSSKMSLCRLALGGLWLAENSHT